MAQSVPPGDITTQPGTKIVFNAPYDDKHTYHIKIINAGGRRIGWAIKTTNMKSVDDHKLKQLARCCICFENYSLNTRAPICGPCGHSFCAICIRKLIYGNLICCCICRKVTFFGPKELGKNIQLLDILENLGLLDPDEEVAIQYASSSNFPENVIEAVEDKDLVKFFDFCFTFVKKFYENKQENLVTNLSMVNPEGQIEQHANEMFVARSRLGDSFDKALARFNECLQTMNSHTSIDRDVQILDYDYGGVDDYIPFMEDNNNDPFGLESATIRGLISRGPSHEVDFLRGFEETEREPPSIMDDTNVDFIFIPINEYDTGTDNDNFLFNEEREEYEDPSFQPGAWNPVSKLFTQVRSQNNNRNN